MFQKLKRYRSEPIESPSIDLSDSFTEMKHFLHHDDPYGKHFTPGIGVKLKRRRLFEENVKRSNAGLLDMPNEVIDHVMSYLNKRDLLHVGATCKRMYSLSCAPVHWTSLNLTGKSIIDTALHRILFRKTKTLALMDSHVCLRSLKNCFD